MFEQTYTRFLDLQKAEAQARESQIEAALEKVRSLTMAMQKSEDLNKAASDMFEQIQVLGMQPWGCGFNIFDKDEKAVTQYMSLADGGISPPFRTPLTEDPFFISIYDARQRGDELLVMESGGESLAETYHYMFSLPGSGEIFGDLEKSGFEMPKFQITHCAYFSQGYLVFITYEPVPEAHDIFKRFAKVFEQTYTRFLDLQKAEAQARESEIELALERVRARTMAMQHSDELAEASFLLDSQIRALGIKTRGCAFNIYGENESTEWFSSEMSTMPVYKTPRENVFLTLYEEGKKGKQMYIKSYTGDACAAHYDYLCTLPVMGEALKKIKESGGSFPDQQIDYVTYFKYGYLLFITLEPVPEAHDIFKRFAKVFEQTYTRFLDLQKAEAQAREAQIEAALERVRSRTMGMQHSDELQDAAVLMFQQIESLGVDIIGCGFNIWDEDRKEATAWMSGLDRIQPSFKTSGSKDIFLRINEAAERGESLFVEEQAGEELVAHYQYMASIPVFRKILEGLEAKGLSAPSHQVMNCTFFSQGYLMFITPDPAESAYDIFKRFAKVFEQTYTRFLDLQKAEAQAREAEIQLALERVRARTMAMQHSDELAETSELLFQQINELGIHPWSCGFNLWYEGDTYFRGYNPGPDGKIGPPLRIPLTEDVFFKTIREAKQRGEEFFVFESEGETLAATYRYMGTLPVVGDFMRAIVNSGYELPKYQVTHCGFFPQGHLMFITLEPHPEDWDIFKRFTKEFEQTYTRFLDLKKAEAQAREGQIQLALERVRSRAMAMQNSEELNELIGTVFTELTKLDLVLTRCIIEIYDPKTMDARWWMANSETPDEPMNFFVQYHEYPANMAFLKAWQERTVKWIYTLEGQTKKDWDDFLFTETELSQLPDFVIAGMRAPEKVYLNASFNTFGNLILASLEPLSDEQFDIMLRFAKVFDLSYTRFNDLKQAETQAREAIKQASVDRVRAEIASMRSTNDLEKITPLIWNELNILGVPFIRCGVFIVNEEKELIHTYLSTPGGQAIAAFTLPFDAEGIGKTVLYNWRNKQPVTIHWTEEEFKRQSINLVSQGAIESEEKYLTDQPPTSLDLHFFPFLQGMLYAGNTEPLSDDEKSLVQSLADAFATAYARYEDFNKLEEAKGKIEATLTELKATQAQLIQSEKMASLGELTAGIAHEIQNPLNFVNNFSEVSAELVDEMNIEMDNGNNEEAKLIAHDLKENLEKINRHGKRAGDIVKGMLQHSRSSTGVKEPTDINALADEYLRLSYHGLRAKDKNFNATIKTDFDESIDKINIIPQDIGRVLLNLFNNAFYAVNEQKSKNLVSYEPTVSVSTKKSDNHVFITVSDNGNGIPQKVLDKIFQPFFTTKPTGQGTGLGLSLSYDVVKAHGGEIKVETKEGEETEFIIQLPV